MKIRVQTWQIIIIQKNSPFFSSKFGDFSRKKLGILFRIFPFSFLFLFLFFWKKKSPKKSYSSRNGLKQTQNHCEITSRLLITHNLLVCHIVILHNSHSSKFITCHSKNGSYQSTIHSFIHSFNYLAWRPHRVANRW